MCTRFSKEISTYLILLMLCTSHFRLSSFALLRDSLQMKESIGLIPESPKVRNFKKSCPETNENYIHTSISKPWTTLLWIWLWKYRKRNCNNFVWIIAARRYMFTEVCEGKVSWRRLKCQQKKVEELNYCVENLDALQNSDLKTSRVHLLNFQIHTEANFCMRRKNNTADGQAVKSSNIPHSWGVSIVNFVARKFKKWCEKSFHLVKKHLQAGLELFTS